MSPGTDGALAFSVRVATEQGPDDDLARVVVVVSGDVDFVHHGELESAFDHLLDTPSSGPRDLLVDLTDVDYCDSCGMRVLLGAARRVATAGGRFRLRGVHGQPSRALRLTGLDRVLGLDGAAPG